MRAETWADVLHIIQSEGYVYKEKHWYFLHRGQLLQWREGDQSLYVRLNEHQTNMIGYNDLSPEELTEAAELLAQHQMTELL